jgi:peptidoglycan pentaglycine glycine transferase (the first glycine)
MKTQPLGAAGLGPARPARGPAVPALDGYSVEVSFADQEPAWEAFLAGAPGAHYTQSSLWARIKAPGGWRAARVTVTRDGRIVAGAQLLMRPLPLAGAIGYVPKGPVLAEASPALAHLALAALHHVARANRVRYLAVQPGRDGLALATLLRAQGFQPQPRLGTCTATLLVDLRPDRDAILAAMKKRTRLNIRRAEREGVSVREGGAPDLDTFYRLLVVASKRKGFPVYTRAYYEALWQTLVPQGHLKLFLAERAGEALAAQLAIPFGETLFSHVSAWSGEQGDAKPNEALEWGAMVWAKEHGYRFYDFEGLDPRAARALVRGDPLPDEPEAGDPMVTRYKLGFGGQVTLLPQIFDYVYNPLLRWAYGALLPAMQRWRVLTRLRTAVSRAIQPAMASGREPS